ncbi:tyrosine-type recombinase/integrase [Asticcacaulis machinosus]|uniref:Integrase arm-type DNA-binding domain-containing protein n=1 Tax=Asticcacaulis machinosus TaxID=2984211 RepID=A0ABT5HH78_9CAUL|nr:site-specific integrase [Asticcacaulis machinosus]MDC7675602.1 integrase arm-type DNA-binding domain-containing protein [Asticcacaulis machinosus]
MVLEMAERIENRLTTKSADAKKEPGLYADGNGLWLQVAKRGGKSWIFRYRCGRATREMGLGSYRDIGVREARIAASAVRQKIAAGVDPLEEKRAAELAAKEEQRRAEQAKAMRMTFGVYARSLTRTWVKDFKNKAHSRSWYATFGSDPEDGVRPPKSPYTQAILDIPIEEVSTPEVVEVLQILADRPETQRRVRARIERVLDAARAMGLRSGDNPARWDGHLEVLLGRPKNRVSRHFAALSHQELPAFMQKLRATAAVTLTGSTKGKLVQFDLALPSMSALALEFTILTAARTSEVLLARRSEFDLDQKLWIVPGERMKSGRVHRVPLQDGAIAILRQLWPLANDPDRYVFIGRAGDGHLSNMAMTMCLRRLMGRGPTVHGMRSAFRDWVGDETDYAREVAEAALAHVVGDKSEQAYRRGDALQRRRMLMDDWARYLDGSSQAANTSAT